MNAKDLDQMDDMELFAVIDHNFVTSIDLEDEVLDFPRMTYENAKVMVIWNSEIFGFNINIVRPYSAIDFKITK